MTEAEKQQAIEEASALVQSYIVGSKKVSIRVVTVRRLLAALAQKGGEGRS